MKRKKLKSRHPKKRRAPLRGERTRRISCSYSQTTPESAESSDFSDRGWYDEEGADMNLDSYDRSEKITVAQKAAKFLRHEGATEPSDSSGGPGTWYSTGFETIDYRTGTDEEKNYHLNGFTPAEEREIFKLVTGRRR